MRSKSCLFFILFVLFGCEFWDSLDTDYCSQSGSFGNKIQLTQYYSFRTYWFDGIKENRRVTYTKYIKGILILNKDSTFSEIILDSSGDTLEIQSGHFFIRNIPKNDWVKNDYTYSFVLRNDSIERKWIVDEDFQFKKIDSLITIENHDKNVDTLLLDIQERDSCFTLGTMELDDMYCPDKHIFSSGVKYCANSLYRDSTIVDFAED